MLLLSSTVYIRLLLRRMMKKYYLSLLLLFSIAVMGSEYMLVNGESRVRLTHNQVNGRWTVFWYNTQELSDVCNVVISENTATFVHNGDYHSYQILRLGFPDNFVRSLSPLSSSPER